MTWKKCYCGWTELWEQVYESLVRISLGGIWYLQTFHANWICICRSMRQWNLPAGKFNKWFLKFLQQWNSKSLAWLCTLIMKKFKKFSKVEITTDFHVQGLFGKLPLPITQIQLICQSASFNLNLNLVLHDNF